MPIATVASGIRELTSRDAHELAELAARLGGGETAGQWRSFLSRPHTVGLGALDGARLAGYAAGEVRVAFGMSGPAAWLEAFAIDPARRGHGVGRSLLRELLRRFREVGASHVYTVVPVHDRSLAPFFRLEGLRDEPLACLGCDL